MGDKKSNAWSSVQGSFPVLLIKLWDIEPARVADYLENTLFIYFPT